MPVVSFMVQHLVIVMDRAAIIGEPDKPPLSHCGLSQCWYDCVVYRRIRNIVPSNNEQGKLYDCLYSKPYVLVNNRQSN